MKNKFGLFSLFSNSGKDRLASSPRLLARLLRDEEGSYLMLMTFVLPVLIGVGGLAGEASLLFYNHRTLQSAADAAAYSAAIASSFDSSADTTTQAKAIVGSYGFSLGTGNNQANVPTPTLITNYAGSEIRRFRSPSHDRSPRSFRAFTFQPFPTRSAPLRSLPVAAAAVSEEETAWSPSVTPPQEITLLMPSNCRGTPQ